MSAYKIEKVDDETYLVLGPGLDGSVNPAMVCVDEREAMLRRDALCRAYAAGLRARDAHEAGRHDSTMQCVDDAPSIRCTPAPGCVFRTSAGLVLTIDPLDGGDCPTVNLADVSEWLADNDPRPGAPLRGDDARRLVESLENRCSPEEAARRIAWAKVASAEMLLPPSKRRPRQPT